jgi:hypothetical protein
MKWEYAVVKFAENKDTGIMEIIRLNGVWMAGDANPTGFEGEFPDFYTYLHKAGQAGWEAVNFVKTEENGTYWYGHLIMKRTIE